MTSLRVAILIDHIAGGGAERFVVELAGGLAARGACTTLCVSRAHPPGRTLAALRRRGVMPLALERSGRLQLGRWRPLLQLLRSGRVDVLNTHLHSSNVYGAMLSAASGVPLVATEHGSTADGRLVRSTLDRQIVARRARFVVAVSEHTRERLAERGFRPQSLRVIPPAPADAGAVPASRADARSSLGVPPEAGAVIGTVCAVRPEKRLDVLIDAAALVARSRNAHLVVVGDGPARRETESYARRVGFRSVTFAGWRDEAPTLLRAFDVFALSSDTEGTPLALIEAMRAGLPIAATAVGGIPAAAPDGECALLVPPRDAAALAGAVERLLDEPALASCLSERAAARATAAGGLERAAAAWFELLQEAAARPATTAMGLR
jgi:glycosyltransferase involved in cell wall biosynthesis